MNANPRRTGGFIDPSITAIGTRQRQLLDEIVRRGLSLHRVHGQGSALRLTGPGVFVVADGLSDLHTPSRRVAVLNTGKS